MARGGKRKKKNTGSPQHMNNNVSDSNDTSSESEYAKTMSSQESSISNTMPSNNPPSNSSLPIYSPGYTPNYTILGASHSNIQTNQTVPKSSVPTQMYTNPAFQTPTHNVNPSIHTPIHSATPCRGRYEGQDAQFNNTEPAWVKTLHSKIDNIGNRINFIESELQSFRGLNDNVAKIEQTLKQVSDDFEHLRIELSKSQQDISEVKTKQHNQEQEIKIIKEQLLQDQTRSMRCNLVFYGIKEQNDEDPEDVVRGFIEQVMNINTRNIEIERSHRIGARHRDRVRPLVVKFLRYKDKEWVRKAAPDKLKGSHFGISEQFPREIANRRKLLIPIMKQEKRNRKKATLVVDKLYTDNATYSVKNSEVHKEERGQRNSLSPNEEQHPINRRPPPQRQAKQRAHGQFGNDNVNFRYNGSQQTKPNTTNATSAVSANINIVSGQSSQSNQSRNQHANTSNFDPLFQHQSDNRSVTSSNNVRPHNNINRVETTDLLNTDNAEMSLISWEPIQTSSATQHPLAGDINDLTEQTFNTQI